MRYLQIVMVWSLLTASFAMAAEETPLSKLDQQKIRVQKICPVSGKPLDNMGDPLKVKVGQEEVFLCCKGCASSKINPKHWATIHKNFAAAQRMCPVMEKALPAKPKFTIVDGHIIYICCPPCTKKIQADSQKYLTKLAGYYEQALKSSAGQTKVVSNEKADAFAGLSESARLRAEVQQICPVSGKPLGENGTPHEAPAGEQDIFLCCKGCAQGKIAPKHWATVANNIKKAQGLCPVMEKELPADAKFIVVEGQLVYVCCPQCTKKIVANPKKYLEKIAGYYKSSLAARRVAQRTPPVPQLK